MLLGLFTSSCALPANAFFLGASSFEVFVSSLSLAIVTITASWNALEDELRSNFLLILYWFVGLVLLPRVQGKPHLDNGKVYCSQYHYESYHPFYT